MPDLCRPTDSGYPREEPYAGKPHVRICEGKSRMAELLDHPPSLLLSPPFRRTSLCFLNTRTETGESGRFHPDEEEASESRSRLPAILSAARDQENSMSSRRLPASPIRKAC